MPRQKKKLTPLQSEYQKELKLLKRRVKSWERKYRATVIDIPVMPPRVTKSSIEKLRQIKWKSVSQETKNKFKEDYQRKYDSGDTGYLESTYNPNTEQTFIDTYSDDWYEQYLQQQYYDAYQDEDEREPVHSQQELDAWIDSLISQILGAQLSEIKYKDGWQALHDLLVQARRAYGDEEFYHLLEKDNNVQRLQEIAGRVGSAYLKKGESGTPQRASEGIAEFATILNNDVPLSADISEALNELEYSGEIGYVNFSIYDEDYW